MVGKSTFAKATMDKEKPRSTERGYVFIGEA